MVYVIVSLIVETVVYCLVTIPCVFVTNLWKMQKFPSLFGILTIMLFYHTTYHFTCTEFLFNFIWKFKKILNGEIYIRIIISLQPTYVQFRIIQNQI